MKFTVKAGVWHDVLALLKSYQSPIDAIPSTHDVLLQVEESKLAVAMVGMKHAAVITLDVSNGEAGRALINPARLLPALSRNKTGYVVVDSNDKGQVSLHWEGTEDTALFEGGIPETFLPVTAPPKAGYLRMSMDESLRIHTVLSPLSMAGGGGFVQVSKVADDRVHFVATDNWIVAKAEVAARSSEKQDTNPTWFLTSDALDIISAVSKVLPIPGDKLNIRVQTTNEFTYIAFPGGFFRSAVPQGTSPIPYEGFFAAHRHGTAKVKRMQFSKDIQAVLTVLSEKTQHIVVEILEGKLRVSGQGRLTGSCSYEIEAAITGTPVPIKIRGDVLLQMVKGALGTEVTLEWTPNFLLVTDEAKETLAALEK